MKAQAATTTLAALARPFAALAVVFCASTALAAPLKVACTGTSAMQGLGSTTGHHVPDELGKALGAGFDVSNFGMQGTTAIASISSSYAATSQMKAALAFNPDVVLFWFGGNDSFQGTWDAHKSEFKADYTSLVHSFQALPTHPKTFLVRLWVFVDGPVQKTVVDQEILPIIDQIAAETGSTLIDYRKQFENHPEYFPDGMHPNDTGTVAIGKFFADSVTTALAAAAGTGGSAPLGGAGGAGGTGGSGGPTETAGGAAGGPSAAGGLAGVGGISGGSGAPSTPTAGSAGTGGASAGVSNATSGGAGTPNVAPVAAANGDSGGCHVSLARGTGAPSPVWLLLAGLSLTRRRTPRQRRAV